MTYFIPCICYPWYSKATQGSHTISPGRQLDMLAEYNGASRGYFEAFRSVQDLRAIYGDDVKWQCIITE